MKCPEIESKYEYLILPPATKESLPALRATLSHLETLQKVFMSYHNREHKIITKEIITVTNSIKSVNAAQSCKNLVPLEEDYEKTHDDFPTFQINPCFLFSIKDYIKVLTEEQEKFNEQQGRDHTLIKKYLEYLENVKIQIETFQINPCFLFSVKDYIKVLTEEQEKFNEQQGRDHTVIKKYLEYLENVKTLIEAMRQ